MASGWEIAAVVGPLVLSFIAIIVSSAVSASPAAIKFFQRSTRRLMSYAFPNYGQCLRFSWDDIPDGRIHPCHSACEHVNPQAIEAHNPSNCFENSIGKVFTRTWSSVDRICNTVTKPYQLPLFDNYIQTDAQTLMAFLLLTVKVCRTCETADVKSMLEIKTYGEIITVHLRAPPSAPNNTALTKFEVERMIEGYPPFYRATFSLPGPRTVQLKTSTSKTDHVDISRGGWVLAVGLSVSHDPIPSLYNMQQLYQRNDNDYWKGTLVMSAFKTIGHTLKSLRDFEKSFYNGHLQNIRFWGDEALNCYDLIMSSAWSLKPQILKMQEIESLPLFGQLIGECPCTKTCLGKNPHAETCGRGQLIRKDAAKKLSVQQCEAALEIFNNYSHSEENLKTIVPVLAEVLQTAILGMCEVEHYFSKTGQKLDFPEVLKGQRHIYLRTCAADSN